jgi:hypothetical protein
VEQVPWVRCGDVAGDLEFPASVDTGSLGRSCSLGDSFVFGW